VGPPHVDRDEAMILRSYRRGGFDSPGSLCPLIAAVPRLWTYVHCDRGTIPNQDPAGSGVDAFDRIATEPREACPDQASPISLRHDVRTESLPERICSHGKRWQPGAVARLSPRARHEPTLREANRLT